ncbi:MAG: hypothetical protein IKF17_04900 [Clostridia bacterium]|nr:hypothetical protein [Clostridia bacterium]
MKQKRRIFYKILYIILVTAIIYNFIYLVNTMITGKKYLNIFGIGILPLKNVVITREGNINSLQQNETIAYYYNGHIKVGAINNIYTDSETGKKYFSTKIENNYYPDTAEMTEKNIIGRKLIEFKNVSGIVKVIQSKVFSVISIIILAWIYHFNRFKFKEKWKRIVKRKYKEAE